MRIIIPAFILFCVFQLKAQEKVKTDNPNIIFILTDDQRFDALGYVGNKLIYTPEMDKLAKEGVYFQNAMVTTPICTASRASILTGLHERTHRFNFQTGNIRESYMIDSYPKILKDNGYYTGFYGKYGVRYDGLDKQFDAYESYDRNNSFKDRRGYYYKVLQKDTVHLTRYTGQKAIDFIAKAETDIPFCLSLSFSAPHAHDAAKEQYFWQRESDSLLQKTHMPGPELAEDKYFEAQPEFVRNGFNRLRWEWRYQTEEKYQHSIKGYYRMISGIDREIFKIREELKKKGIDKNTVIILMGDNGYFMGERQLAGKWLLYDNSIRVPLIVFDPRQKNQKDSDIMALNIDVPATILDLAGLKKPKTWQGKSLMPIVSNKTKNFDRDTVLIEHIWEFDHIPPSEGLRTKEWKYFRYVNNKSVEELYYLKDDPKEINNLAKKKKYSDKLKSFREKTNELILKYSDVYSSGPSDLVVECIRNTDGVTIFDSKPEYGWVVPCSDIIQLGYQILVSSSKENSMNNIGDVWDSGQIRSSSSSEVEHGGESLKNGATYYWKVRIWDQENRLTDYSKMQSFTISNAEKNISQLSHQAYWDNNTSNFKSSDIILNKVWNSSKSSIKTIAFNGENYVNEDCNIGLFNGAYAYSIQLSHYATDKEYAVAREHIEKLIVNPGLNIESQLYLALMLHADYTYTGNAELIKKYYDKIKPKTLYRLTDENGLLAKGKLTPEFLYNTGFKKRCEDLVKKDINNIDINVINILFHQNMKIMSEFASILGKPQEKLEFEVLALKAKMALNKKITNNKGSSAKKDEMSLNAYILASAFDILPQEYLSDLVNINVADDIYKSQYLIDALYKNREQDRALDVLINSSTLKIVPTNIVSRRLWGIQPKTPGFGVANINPKMGNLKNSSIKVPTIKGSIKAEYLYENPRLQIFNIEIPGNMVAEFGIDLKSKEELIHNGKKVNTIFSSIRLEAGKHQIEIITNSF
ncbi:sulfatase-like hydrolase/transferase [Wocania ichthyoenteri]|uniref:sulfatase-like hydrolase/transferase n=1 Tax=Wocania ichthyoenteri TaxID=1230531 RepID=UPI00053DE31A|nr:sulfatase-like hydrolase/transferase [Wocania ichthyoenteri]